MLTLIYEMKLRKYSLFQQVNLLAGGKVLGKSVYPVKVTDHASTKTLTFINVFKAGVHFILRLKSDKFHLVLYFSLFLVSCL